MIYRAGELRALNNLGFVDYERGQLAAALASWRAATVANPSLAESWAGLAMAPYAKGDFDAAASVYQKALELEPRYESSEWVRYAPMWTPKALQVVNALMAIRAETSSPTAVIHSYCWWNFRIPCLVALGLVALSRLRLCAVTDKDSNAECVDRAPFPPVRDAHRHMRAASAARLVRSSPLDPVPQEIVLLQDDLLLGRAEGCDVILPHASISAQHVRVTRHAQGYVIHDLHRAQGTYVNGRRVNERLLQDGWRVQLGEVEFVFYNPRVTGLTLTNS